MLLLLILIQICGALLEMNLAITRRFILQEDSAKEVVKDNIFYANTLPSIEVEFGDPRQKVRMVIDTFTSHSWIWNEEGANSPNQYHSALSSSFNFTQGKIDVVYDYNLFKMDCRHASEIIWINDKAISSKLKYGLLSCTSFNNVTLNIDGYLSFALSTNNTTSISAEYDLLRLITHEGYINSPVFSIYYTSDTRGVLRIGDVDPKIEPDQISYCALKENKAIETSVHMNHWVSRLYLISFGSYVHSNNSTVIFGIGQEHIFAPIEHIELLEAIKLETDKYSLNCFLREREKVMTLYCEEFNLAGNYFEPLELQLESYRLVIKPFDLFVWSEEEDDLLECVVHINRHMSNWLLGDPGLKREYIIFDSVNRRIGFVDKEFVVDNLTPSFFNSIWLYFAVWLFFSVAGYYMLIQKRRLKRPSRKQTDFSTKFVH